VSSTETNNNSNKKPKELAIGNVIYNRNTEMLNNQDEVTNNTDVEFVWARDIDRRSLLFARPQRQTGKQLLNKPTFHSAPNRLHLSLPSETPAQTRNLETSHGIISNFQYIHLSFGPVTAVPFPGTYFRTTLTPRPTRFSPARPKMIQYMEKIIRYMLNRLKTCG